MNMNKFATRLFQGITLTSFGIGLNDFLSHKAEAVKLNSRIDVLHETNTELQVKIAKLDTETAFYKENIEYVKSFVHKRLDNLRDLHNQLNSSVEEINQAQTIEEKASLFDAHLDVLKNTLAQAEATTRSISDALTKSNNNFTGDIFINEISQSINDLNQYMNSLPLEQYAAFLTLLGCIIIFISLASIIAVLLGNSIIEFLKLGERYPRLKKYIDLRLKLRRYYLILDFSIITFVLLGMVFVNIVVLV